MLINITFHKLRTTKARKQLREIQGARIHVYVFVLALVIVGVNRERPREHGLVFARASRPAPIFVAGGDRSFNLFARSRNENLPERTGIILQRYSSCRHWSHTCTRTRAQENRALYGVRSRGSRACPIRPRSCPPAPLPLSLSLLPSRLPKQAARERTARV